MDYLIHSHAVLAISHNQSDLPWPAILRHQKILQFGIENRRCKRVSTATTTNATWLSLCSIFQSEIDNLTWHEVQRKIREVQSEQQMCIHKEQLTELDIYHRILRWVDVSSCTDKLIRWVDDFFCAGEVADRLSMRMS